MARLGEPAVKPLIQSLKDIDYTVREKAAGALGKMRDIRAVEPLIQALKDLADEQEFLSRQWKVMAKSFMTKPLSQVQREEDCSRALNSIAKALVRIGKPAVEPLIFELRDRHYAVRMKAAWALGMIGDKRAVEPLLQVIEEDKEKIVQDEASGALTHIFRT